MKKKNKNKIDDPFKLFRTTWGTGSPVQKTHTDKTKYSRKTKHKNKDI